ncbi:MAG: tRNA (adenosine(37)-N6)-threonylcarbamoyltransferase complex dimerization subunit type 1 TsaB, partial [Pseudoxanthomonas sp.]|nr:tRNA (adenosine(37)-N6)-threonylcarbamoyltransferase complex dimerization subunit type 1 TsaB [Pseudoxanthomonas sp.]
GVLGQRLGADLVRLDPAALPRAADLARLAAVACAHGGAMAADRVEPAYLRDNVALTLAEQRALRASRGQG